MGLFRSDDLESSPQDRVDLDHLTRRVAALEAAVGSLQGQLAALTSGPGAAPGAAQAPVGVPQALPQALPQAVAPAVAPAQVAPGEPPFLAQVRALKARGKLIQAIKVYRDGTGVDLRTAKDAVESLV